MKYIALNTAAARAALAGLAELVAAAAPPTDTEQHEQRMALLQRQIARLRVEAPAASRPEGVASEESGESSGEGSGSHSSEESQPERVVEEEEEDEEGKGQVARENAVAQRVAQMVHFTSRAGEQYAVFRAVLPSLGLEPAALPAELAALARPALWIYFVLHGGHFGAAAFRDGKMVAHKTLHRYVIRAKRGTLQSTRDRSGGKPRSFGASLRRHNETMLHEEIAALIGSWTAHVAEAQLIFLQTSAVKRSVFFGTKAEPGPLARADTRVRSIPFDTHRPTLTELAACHTRLFALYPLLGQVDDSAEADSDAAAAATAAASETNPVRQHESVQGPGKTQQPLPQRPQWKQTEKEMDSHGEEEDGDEPATPAPADHPYEVSPLYTAAADGNAASVAELLAAGADVAYDWNTNAETALHAAARVGSAEVVTLLLAHGCDPGTKNARSQLPFFVAKRKEARDAFRRFMAAHPDAFDYAVAQIPSALTAEMEEEQARRQSKKAEKNRERKKKQKEAEKKKKAKAAAAAAAAAEQAAAEKAAAEAAAAAAAAVVVLSPAQQARELRAAAALQRRTGPDTTASTAPVPTTAAAASVATGVKVCSQCGGPCPIKMFFSRLAYYFCSQACMRAHRLALGD